MKRFVQTLALTIAATVAVTARGAETPTFDALVREFVEPPDSARPWVYWFWLNGNISKEGITADLEAMRRVGIGGVLIMEVDQGAPVGPVDFMSPQWRELFRHVHAEAQRLGLEVNMNNDAGWNGSGGPWITPAQSMQKVVWSEVEVTGPQQLDTNLPQGETNAGFYRDISVLAFPAVGSHRIDRIRAKSMVEVGGVVGIARDELPGEMVIDRAKIQILTDRMDDAGRLVWEVPPGNWTVVRFGHTTTGVENAPAPKSGRGLECDKLSREGIEANFEGMMRKLAADTGIAPGQTGAGLVATHIDSWENGSQNWTPLMRDEFLQRRGYDLLPFLPVVTGRVVDSGEISERFLWDLRQTVNELVIENYAGHMRKLAHEHGMRFTVEAYGSPCDSISYAGQSDEPMGEFWTPSGAIETCKIMASAAHVYGKRIVGAEAFTSGDQERWREHPALLKPLGDRVFCEGINRFVFHRYALQPWAARRNPGMTMGPWGQHYERTQTWWDWTPAWHRYLSRCQFLLRQGLVVADICYLQPEAPPQGPGDHPRGDYAWDDCTADVVVDRMTVADGRLRLPDGMSYRILVLPDLQTMTPRLLRKIKQLVAEGATVLGPRPLYSPSLQDYPQCDADIRNMSAQLWGDCDGQSVKEHRFGQGRIVWGETPEKYLARARVAADFTSDQPLHTIHRRAEDVDIYFVANPQPYQLAATCSFRVQGKVPEFWWPQTGKISRVAMRKAENGVTCVVVPFEPHESVFVVFSDANGDDDPVVSVSRDAAPLLSATPRPPVKITVIRARYGILDDPQRSRDVTAKVQRNADRGERIFRVSSMAQGDDPAEGAVKTLVVEYMIKDKSFTVRARDPNLIHLTPDAAEIKIDKARYGVLDDPQRTRDVQDKLQRLIDAGERSFRVARMAEGDDPAFLVVKTLELEFTLDGQRHQVSGTDPEIINLVQAAAPPAPVVSVTLDPRDGLQLEAREAGVYDVQFASGRSARVDVRNAVTSVPVKGPWQVRFAPDQGAPDGAVFDELISWSRHSEFGIKHYSGVATYANQLTIPQGLIGSNRRICLDLGAVHVMARVTLNGKRLPLLWKSPFRVDVTDVAKSGENQLEIDVVNLWPNRMIGDEYLPEDSLRNPNGTLQRWPQWIEQGGTSPTGRITFTSWRLWKKDDPLLPSGLLGPVIVESVQRVPIDTQ